MSCRSFLVAVLSLLVLVRGVTAQPPGFALTDVRGREHRPFASKDVRAVVLAFVLPDCPIANGYAPELQRLSGEYKGRGVAFFLVQVDPDLTAAETEKHAREYGYTCPVVHDREHTLVRRAGMTRVPAVAVFTPDGVRRYRGRIDDRYADLGKRRGQPTSYDLRDALDSVLNNRPVTRPETQAIGCPIPPLATKGSP
jgi:hypothetical protein